MKVKTFASALVFLTSLSLSNGPAHAGVANVQSDQVPDSIASLGDSISAGALASYSRLKIGNPFIMIRVIWDILGTFVRGDLRSVEKRYLSWSTGMDKYRRINTHAFRLKQINPKLKIVNVARSGDDSNDVVKVQLKQVQDWSQQHLRRPVPDYVTLLIGANDVCGQNIQDMTPPDVFQDNIRIILHSLLARSVSNKILVTDLPAMERVPSNRDSSLLNYFAPFHSCADFWRRAPYCQNVLRDFRPEYQEIIAERVELFNRILADTVEEMRGIYGDRVRFAPALHRYGVIADELAVDCFHPDIKGQKRIAQSTWEQSWWPQKWGPPENRQYVEKIYSVDPELKDSDR